MLKISETSTKASLPCGDDKTRKSSTTMVNDNDWVRVLHAGLERSLVDDSLLHVKDDNSILLMPSYQQRTVQQPCPRWFFSDSRTSET